MFKNDYYTVRFHGGPCAGSTRVYPNDQGHEIVMDCENGDVVRYVKDDSICADKHFEETGERVYECVWNGAAIPVTPWWK